MVKNKADKLRSELRRLNDRLAANQRDCQNLTEDRDKTADRLAQIEKNEIRWSDHGLLRYLERVRKTPIDAEALLAEVVTDKLQDLVNKLGGSGKFPCDGYSVVLRDHHIVTILEHGK